MSPAFYKRFHVFVFLEICVSRGAPPQHQAREAWEFSHFPKALARLVLRHAATARKTAPLQKLKRSFGLRSVRGIVVAPWRWRRVFRSATTEKGHVLGRERGPRRRRPAGPARKIHATAIVGSVGADSNADGASMAPAAPLGKSRCLVSEGVARSRRTSVDAAIQRA